MNFFKIMPNLKPYRLSKCSAILTLFILITVGCASGSKRNGQNNSLFREDTSQTEFSFTQIKEKCLINKSDLCYLVDGKLNKDPRQLYIHQGPTTEKEATFSVVGPVELDLKFFFYDETTQVLTMIADFEKRSFFESPMAAWSILLKGLSHKNYKLLVFSDDFKLLDTRIFKTFSSSGDDLRFAVASCMDDSYVHAIKSNWEQLEALAPDAVFLIGDNVYVDKVNNEKVVVNSGEWIWKRYVETRAKIPYFKMPVLIPTYAIWDDHDYGLNDGDRRFSLKDDSLLIFRSFFPSYDLNNGQYEKGPGVSAKLSLRNQSFYFLDNRYFRSPNISPDAGSFHGEDQSHFGAETEKWLYHHLKNEKQPTYLLSGDQFFSGSHKFESYESNHPQSFKDFLKELKQVKVPIVFISGDRHILEIQNIEKQKIGYGTFEFTSSPMHGRSTAGIIKSFPNPNAVFEHEGASGFLILNSHSGAKKLEIHATGFTEKKIQVLDQNFEILKR